MDPRDSGFPAEALTRRQFGLLLGGGALLLAAGGTYGVIARSESIAPESGFATPFGNITVLRAGRFARLDAHGRMATSNLTLAASHFGGPGRGNAQRTFVQVHGNVPASGGHDHHGGVDNPGRRQPVNLTWGDVVVLELEIRNSGADPVLFSPGQLRLRLAGSQVTVTPQDSDHSPGAITAHANERMMISYLAPHTWARFELEFTDDQDLQPRRLPLPPLTTTEIAS